MKALISTALTATLVLSGCATSAPPTSRADESSMAPSERQALLESQSRQIRTRIIQLKQQVVVQEVMLTNVERRAAMSQVTLSHMPNTEILSEPAPALAQARPEADRLSVAVRPAPAAAPVVKQAVKPTVRHLGKKKKKPIARKTGQPAPAPAPAPL